jgi:hypothetical protein
MNVKLIVTVFHSVTVHELGQYVVSVCIKIFIPISRPTDATCDRFLFSVYMFITLHVSSVKRSSSGVPHRTHSLQFLCLCLSAALSCKNLLEYMKMHGPGNIKFTKFMLLITFVCRANIFNDCLLTFRLTQHYK